MKNIIFILIIIRSSLSFAQTPSNDPNWELYFDDEFNTLDPTIWDVKNNFDHYAYSNTNAQHVLFISNNVSVNNGKLEITIKHEVPHFPCPSCCTSYGCSDQYYDYTSGYVKSKINFQYGYVEASIKFPDATTPIPSLKTEINAGFWTTIGNGVAAHSFGANELDVIEANYEHPYWKTVPTDIHTCYISYPPQQYDCPPGYPTHWPLKVAVPSFVNSYHKFAVEWDPGKIIWYLDDNVIRNSPNPGIFDPLSFIFDIGFNNFPNYTGGFPYTMYADYFKAYKLKDDCSHSINACNYNFSTHDNKVKELINIGGNGCSNTVSSGSNVYLRASDYVNLSGDFEVPAGTTFFADANNNCNSGFVNYHCSYPLYSCNYNFSGYNNETKTRIQLGGTGCSASIASGNHVSLKAIETIILDPGFKAELGSVTEMKIVTCQ